MKKTILILFMTLSNLVFSDIRDDVKNNKLEAIKTYLEAGASEKEINEIFADAIKYEHKEVQYFLLDRGASYEYAFIKYNNIEVLKIFLERESLSEFKDSYGNYLNEFLSDSIYYEQSEIEKYLLEKGATYDGALLREVSRGHDSEKVEKILKKGANPNSRDEFGYTSLQDAVRSNKLEFVKLLIKYGGNPNLEDNHLKTSYDLAAEDGYTEVLKLLPKFKVKSRIIGYSVYFKKLYIEKMSISNRAFNDTLTWSVLLLPPLGIVLLTIMIFWFLFPILLLILTIKFWNNVKMKRILVVLTSLMFLYLFPEVVLMVYIIYFVFFILKKKRRK